MIEKIIAFSAKNRILIFIFSLVGALWGLYALSNISLDAIPDLSDPQVIIKTDWPGRSPDLIEDQITYPLVSAMVAAPKARVARGISMFGVSFVYLIFEEGTDLYWARTRVLEYLDQIKGELPQGVTPVLGPDATGVGWVLSYSLVDKSGKNSTQDLRAFQDWKLRYLLEAIPGVSEVATVGGFQKQYEIQINPNALAQYGISLKEIAKRVNNSNRDVGGRVLEMSEREYFVRGLGYIKSLKDIEAINLKTSPQGAPVLLKDVAKVALVPEMRRGAVDFNGEGEAVSGIVVMRFGENAYTVAKEVKKVLEKIKPSLPQGTEVVITYDRSQLIGRSIDTLSKKLSEEMLVVMLVIGLFLWHFRSTLVPLITLPTALLLSFIPMYYLDLSANIMSLGGLAIAIGAMVDAAIVIVENVHKNLAEWELKESSQSQSEVIIGSIQEVGRQIFFSLLVIAVSFIPIFALEGQEGRLFKPLAFTKNASMFFAALLAITLIPALVMSFFGKSKKGKKLNILPEEKHPISVFLIKHYTPVMEFLLRHPKKAIFVSCLILGLTVFPFLKLGSEFLPPLNEGDLLYMPTTLPGISIETARNWLQKQDKLIKSLPEVKTVFGKVGRADTATDPAPLSMVETVIQLKNQKDWPKVYHERWYSHWAPHWLKTPLAWFWPEQKRRSWQELIETLNQRVQLPGATNAWLFPIRTRIDMLTTGIRTPVGIKLFGDNLETLQKLAVNLEALVPKLQGTGSVIAERTLGGYYLDIKIKRENLNLFGMTLEDAQSVVEGAIGSQHLTTTVEGRERFPVTMRYQKSFRKDLNALKNSLVSVNGKKQIPLSQVADFNFTQGPPVIRDENGLLSTWVFVDLKSDQDIGSYVKDLEKLLKAEFNFPAGYTYSIAGQHEFLKRAEKRLRLVVPLTLFLVIFLLYLNTRSWPATGIVLLAVPFSLIGAVWLLYLLDYNMSLAVWVGLIALAGVDAENGVVMLLYLELAHKKASAQNKLKNMGELKEAVLEGAVKRIRPKLMTVLTDFFGLLPIMWAASYESGADMTKRIAAPLVGGIFTSFLMELLIYPCLYLLWKGRKVEKKSASSGGKYIP